MHLQSSTRQWFNTDNRLLGLTIEVNDEDIPLLSNDETLRSMELLTNALATVPRGASEAASHYSAVLNFMSNLTEMQSERQRGSSY